MAAISKSSTAPFYLALITVSSAVSALVSVMTGVAGFIFGAAMFEAIRLWATGSTNQSK